MRTRRRVILALIVPVLAVAVSAPAVEPAVAAAPSTAGPRFTTWTETFVDVSRRTAAGVQTPAAPDRTLATAIYRPRGKGPFPLIVFAHGLSGHPDKFTGLLGSWAAAGYVVAAPSFPLTNDDVPGSSSNAGDLAEQPGDISFVLTEVLQLSRDPEHRLHRTIDRRHIGAAGMSLGGATTYAVTFDDCCRDDRFTAAMVLNGILVPLSGAPPALDGHVPLFIAHSDADPLLPLGTARANYDRAEAPAWLATFHGAGHSPQWEDDPTPYDALAERITVDFWDATLGGERAAYARLVRDATVDGTSSIEVRRATS